MNTPFVKQILYDKARRAIGMANINARELCSLPIIIPDLTLQEKFMNEINYFETVIKKKILLKNKLDNM